MSKTLTVVAAGAPASLVSFATTLVGKATKNSVAVKQAAAAASGAVVVGAEAPAGVHTSVVSATGAGIYEGVKATVVRAVLPKKGDDELPLRDAIDVMGGSLTEADLATATASFKRSAKAAVDAAKEGGHKKVTIMVKQQSAFANLNKIFVDAAKSTVEAAGLAVEVAPTSVVTNRLIMFPESAGVVLTNDTPSTANVEKAFAGVVGGAPASLLTEDGAAFGGHSTNSVATAVASALKGLGFTAEAAIITKAVAASKSEQEILGAF